MTPCLVHARPNCCCPVARSNSSLPQMFIPGAGWVPDARAASQQALAQSIIEGNYPIEALDDLDLDALPPGLADYIRAHRPPRPSLWPKVLFVVGVLAAAGFAAQRMR